MSGPIAVRVPLGDRSYDVLVGAGAVGRLKDLIPNGVRRAVVHQRNRAVVHGRAIQFGADDAGPDALWVGDLDLVAR